MSQNLQYLFFFLLIIFWFLFSFTSGFREARYYFFKDKPVPENDEHILFTIHRSIFFAPALMLFITCNISKAKECMWLYMLSLVLFSLSFVMTLPFWHDGSYYRERNKLDKNVYPGRWTDFNDSTAFFDFTWPQRLIMIIVGSILYVVSILM